jgi:hypothetical protein
VRRKGWQLWGGLLLIGAGTLLILIGWPTAERALAPEWPPIAPPTRPPEPLVPTRTPTGEAATDPPMVATSTQSPWGTPTSQTELGRSTLWQGRPRWGIGVASGPISRYDVEPLRLGWYLDWATRADPPRPGDVAYAQMIRLGGDELRPNVEEIAIIAQANPGSLWLVGNEPDVIWQDNVTPATYAQLYHDAYTAVKHADPTAQVAAGGVSQPTPLRLRYLDAVLGAYRQQFGADMPADAWSVHNFILREERGSWGVDIPPDMPDDQGMRYQVDDNGSLDIFRRQIMGFRRWMAQRGYQDRPLIVSEYGILMPEDYGFPPERVAAFMTGTFDFFLTAVDPALGYPADDYRLVQLWCWYSLDDLADHYPTGNLFDPQTQMLTLVGREWARYVRTSR